MTAKRKRIDEQLRAAIKASGLTHYRIAKDAGVSPDQLARFVAGKREIRSSAFAAIAEVLGMNLQVPRWMSGTYPILRTGEAEIALLFSNGARLLLFLKRVPDSQNVERKLGRLLNDDLREHLQRLSKSGATHVAFDFEGGGRSIEAFEIKRVIDAIEDPEFFDPSILGKPTSIRLPK